MRKNLKQFSFKVLLSELFIVAVVISNVLLIGCNAKVTNKNKDIVENAINDTSITDETLIELTNTPIREEPRFNSVYIEKTIDEFNALGFVYGDSVDITFSNGYKLDDIPYYNGYYGSTGGSLLVAYPGYDYIAVCITNGDGLWQIGKFKNGDTANIVLRERGKYKTNQDLLNKYTHNRADYGSDEIFANFRNVKVGNLKENILYRGASPVDNRHNRAKYANDLMEKVGIKYDIDLSDNEDDLKKHFEKDDFNSNYFKALYDDGKYVALSMKMNYKSKEFAEKIVKAMTEMANNVGPYYVHCVEGKDRTGFLCMVIEGLAGANYDEIVNDYMLSYKNYYGIDDKEEIECYNIIKEKNIDDMLRYIADSDPTGGTKDLELDEIDWVNVMGRYLTNNGMTDEDIDKWYKNLTQENYSDPD